MLLENPKVSVILSVYNGESFLAQAIESILKQTFADFELIIIDDGSRDKTRDIVNSFKDERIVLITNEKNLGLIRSLNKGIAAARGEFIARMDADDISDPERFGKQIVFLEKNPDIGVLGTAVRHTDAKGRDISVLVQPLSHGGILWKMCFECAIIHPTVMMRRNIFQAGEGWMRLAKRTRFANLPDVLHMHRLHSASIGNTQSKTQYELSLPLREGFLKNMFNITISANVNIWFSYNEIKLLPSEIKEGLSILFDIYEHFVTNGFSDNYSKDFIREDFIRRSSSLARGGEGLVIKRGVQALKRLLPAPVRHKLKTRLGDIFRL